MHNMQVDSVLDKSKPLDAYLDEVRILLKPVLDDSLLHYDQN